MLSTRLSFQMNISAGAGRPPGRLLPAAVFWGPVLAVGEACCPYFRVFCSHVGWASALTGGCRLAGCIAPHTARLYGSPRLPGAPDHLARVCLSEAAGPALLMRELDSGHLHLLSHNLRRLTARDSVFWCLGFPQSTEARAGFPKPWWPRFLFRSALGKCRRLGLRPGPASGFFQ